MYEIVVAAFKGKLLAASLSRLTMFGIAGVWVLTFSFWGQAWHAFVRPVQNPTPDALEQHLDYVDKRDNERINDLKGDIVSRLDRLEQDRDGRRQQSDERFKSLSGSVDSLKHDMAFIWGGGIIGTGLVTLLLTLNVIKVSNTEKKLSQSPVHPSVLNSDIETMAKVLDYMRQEKEKQEQSRTRDRRG